MPNNLDALRSFDQEDPKRLRAIIAALIIQAGGLVELDLDMVWSIERHGATIRCSEIGLLIEPGEKMAMAARMPITGRVTLPAEIDDADFLEIRDSDNRLVTTVALVPKGKRET